MWQAEAVKELTLSASPATAVGEQTLTLANRCYSTVLSGLCEINFRAMSAIWIVLKSQTRAMSIIWSVLFLQTINLSFWLSYSPAILHMPGFV